MVINTLQIGPCTLDEAAALMADLANAAGDPALKPADRNEAAAVVEAQALVLGEDRSRLSISAQRHALIRATFEGSAALPALANPFEEVAADHESLAPPSLELPYDSKNDEGNMEAIALYLSRARYGKQYGIYLHASRLIELAMSKGLDLVKALVPAVGMHELFHAYVESVMERAAYALHACHPCLWEEAAANRAAVYWCQCAGQDSPALLASLMPTRSQGGIPGYGDWPKVAGDYPVVVPRALATGACSTMIDNSDWVVLVSELLHLPKSERDAALRSQDLWAGMAARFTKTSERVVPVYIDLMPWGS